MPAAYKRVLLIDNQDSFTYNLLDYLRRLGCDVRVYRNTADPTLLLQEAPDLVVLSPGPKLPRDANNLMAIIAKFHNQTPMLGICLGHQALVEFFGGTLTNTGPVHGKAAGITHDGKTLYQGLPAQIEVARYHSWSADQLPAVLEVTARANDGTVMGVRHRYLPIEGVQFHPESVLSMRSDVGFSMLKNLVEKGLGTGFPTYKALMHRMQHAAALTEEDLSTYVEALSDGRLADDHQLALLVALSFRLNEPDVLAAFCKVLLGKATLGQDSRMHQTNAVDLCGTGGSGLPRLNTSTLASLLLSAVGLPVMKHGNRAASGRYGSFDLLADLGLPLTPDEPQILEAFRATRLAFVFARQAHPVVGRLVPARTRVGIPTLFNVLGPLLNPYRPAQQLIGTAFAEYAPLLLNTAVALGRSKVLVVRGGEGLDEVSVSAPTQVWAYEEGNYRVFTLSPEDFGIEPVAFEQVSVHRPQDNLSLAQSMLAGNLTSPHHKLVLVNAATAYHHFVSPIGYKQAYSLLEDALRAGRAGEQLKRLVTLLTPTQMPLPA